jgi:nicotinate-nucleotide adenylyltransferase
VRIGVYGGTFNPLHIGHLVCAEHVREEFSLDTVLFMPSRRPVHKELKAKIDAEDRARMIEGAIGDNRHFALSRMELDRVEESYTILTVRQLLREREGAGLFLLVGADSYAELHTWREYRALLDLVSLVVMPRPGCDAINDNLASCGGTVHFASNPHIGVSSSEIRERVRSGKQIRYLVHPSTEEYIQRKGLYRP